MFKTLTRLKLAKAISQKRIGGLQAVRAPFFPANALFITRLDNLSIYWQEGKHRLMMPNNQARTTGCAVAEEMGDAAKKGYIAKNPIPLPLLQRTLDLTEPEDMPDKVRGELYKWLAYSQRDNHLLQPAFTSLLRALELDLNVGVKADIKQLEKILKSQQEKNDSD